MDKQQRGMLLVEKEETEEKIAWIRDTLRNGGQMLRRLADAMIGGPENILFSNAPLGLGEVPMKLLNGPVLIWDQIPKIEQVAKLIQDLRREQTRLVDIERSLRPETF